MLFEFRYRSGNSNVRYMHNNHSVIVGYPNYNRGLYGACISFTFEYQTHSMVSHHGNYRGLSYSGKAHIMMYLYNTYSSEGR